MRAVLDPNVLVSALISPRGAPAALVRAWVDGEFELIVSPHLLDELERVLGYPKLRKRVTARQAEEAVEWLRRSATALVDPTEGPVAKSPDPDDDYLLALAAEGRAALVSGDQHLLSLRGGNLPIYSPADFRAALSG